MTAGAHRTNPAQALALVAGSLLLLALVLEFALRLEEGIRLDPKLAGRLVEPEASARRPGVIRILALGDSFTRGVYLKEENAYPAELARILTNDGLAAEVLNFGVPGTNTSDQLRIAEEALSKHDPEIILLGFFANDIETSHEDKMKAREEEAMLPRADRADRRSAATRLLRLRNRSYLLRYVSPRLAQLASRAGISMPGAVEYAPRLDAVFRENRPGFQRCQEALLGLAELARSRRVQLLVLVFPAIAPFDERYPLPSYHRAVASFCRENGIPVLDLLPAFREERPHRLQASLLDTHPNARAYGIVAKEVAEWLKAEGWLDLP